MARYPIRFGKYLLLERVNVGGMAEVFKAKTFGVAGFERIVAIKRILPNMVEDDEFIKMFIDEARIAVQLNHANVAQIYELGQQGGNYYIAMEYVPSRDLRTLLDRMRQSGSLMPIPQAAYVASKICEGLDYAHRKKDPLGKPMNIIHRDVSPQNVLLSYDGEVKIIDFGIAKAANRASKTQAGVLKGKFGYMSPEQVRGLAIDHRSDIFAVGVLLYEMLTGERLFVGESDFSTLERVRNAEVLPPTTYNKKISSELEDIVLRSLAREAGDRYPWAADLAEDLQRFMIADRSIFSAKRLSEFMHETYAPEIALEQAKMEEYLKVSAPPEMMQEMHPDPVDPQLGQIQEQQGGYIFESTMPSDDALNDPLENVDMSDSDVVESYDYEDDDDDDDMDEGETQISMSPFFSDESTADQAEADAGDDDDEAPTDARGRAPRAASDMSPSDTPKSVPAFGALNAEMTSMPTAAIDADQVAAVLNEDFSSLDPLESDAEAQAPAPPVMAPDAGAAFATSKAAAEETGRRDLPPVAARAEGTEKKNRKSGASGALLSTLKKPRNLVVLGIGLTFALILVIGAIIARQAMNRWGGQSTGLYVVASRSMPAPDKLEVLIDNRVVATQLPARITDLQEGTHKILVRAAGYTDFSQNLVFQDSEELNVQVVLFPLAGASAGVEHAEGQAGKQGDSAQGHSADKDKDNREVVAKNDDSEPKQKDGQARDEKHQDAQTEPETARVDAGQKQVAQSAHHVDNQVKKDVVKDAEKQQPANEPAALELSSNPSGATIIIDRKERGKTPLKVGDLPVGKTLQILIKLNGYKTWKKRISLRSGDSLPLNANLVANAKGNTGKSGKTSGQKDKNKGKGHKKRGPKVKLVINTKPPASVIIDGRRSKRHTPIMPGNPLDLPAGRHTITFETSDSARYSYSVVLKEGSLNKLIVLRLGGPAKGNVGAKLKK